MGFLSADALTVAAREFPEKNFSTIGTVEDLPNVASIVFEMHKGSFLAGASAALMTETGTIGFIVGTKMSFIQKLQVGFEHMNEHKNNR